MTLPSCLLLFHSSACLFQLGTQLTDFCPFALHVLHLLLQCSNGSCLSVCIHITVVKLCCMFNQFNSCSCAGDVKECPSQAQRKHCTPATMIHRPLIYIGLDNLSMPTQALVSLRYNFAGQRSCTSWVLHLGFTRRLYWLLLPKQSLNVALAGSGILQATSHILHAHVTCQTLPQHQPCLYISELHRA